MKTRDIYSISQHTYLTKQQAVWYVCFLLQSGDTYQTKIQADLQEYPNLKLSACVLNSCLNWLLKEGIVSTYQQPIKGRGKARKMYQINPSYQAIVNDFANLWRQRYESRF